MQRIYVMPQNRITILCTRDVDKALLEDASSKNISLDIVPFIKTEPALTSEVLKEVQKSSMRSGAVIFTSSNAVDAIVTSPDLQKTNLVWPKIFCIGHATKRAVAKHFGEASIAGVGDNANELAKEIVDANAREVIFFCGDQRRDELPGLLKRENVKVKEIIVYKTIATPKKIKEQYDGILFFSPSAVKSFFENNFAGDQAVLFAIGHTTADEISKFSKNKIVVSDMPDKKSLMDKAISYFQTNPIHY